MMIMTEETTTAWVVARPTPWVPPSVRMPKKHPTVAMVKPEKSALVRPSTMFAVGEGGVGGVEIHRCVQVEQGDRDEGSSGDADRVRDNGEEEEHEDGGNEAGGDEFCG